MTVSYAAPAAGSDSPIHTTVASAGPGQGAQRAGAREDTPTSGQLTRQSIGQSEVTFGDQIEGLWARWLGWVSPPDIWAKDRPSLSKMWAHATHGQWARPGGICRRTGQIYTVLVAFPVATACKYVEWLAERGSRLAAAVVLVIVLAQFPPLSWLL